MLRRRARRAPRLRHHVTTPPSEGSVDYTLLLALDAKLFGRVRLLTIDASIDVVEPLAGRVLPLSGTAAWNAAGVSRAEVEALVRDAQRTLAEDRRGDDLGRARLVVRPHRGRHHGAAGGNGSAR